MNHYEDILHLGRDIEGFYTISRSKNLEYAKKGKYVWDITFRDPEATEFLEGLKAIKNQILEDNNILDDKNLKQPSATFIKDISENIG